MERYVSCPDFGQKFSPMVAAIALRNDGKNYRDERTIFTADIAILIDFYEAVSIGLHKPDENDGNDGLEERTEAGANSNRDAGNRSPDFEFKLPYFEPEAYYTNRPAGSRSGSYTLASPASFC